MHHKGIRLVYIHTMLKGSIWFHDFWLAPPEQRYWQSRETANIGLVSSVGRSPEVAGSNPALVSFSLFINNLYPVSFPCGSLHDNETVPYKWSLHSRALVLACPHVIVLNYLRSKICWIVDIDGSRVLQNSRYFFKHTNFRPVEKVICHIICSSKNYNISLTKVDTNVIFSWTWATLIFRGRWGQKIAICLQGQT